MLPRDVARCTGDELVTGAVCPEREQCARYMAYRAERADGGGRGLMVMVG